MKATALTARPHEQRGTTNSEDETWLLRRRRGPAVGGREVTPLVVVPEDQAPTTRTKRSESMYDERHREHSRDGCASMAPGYKCKLCRSYEAGRNVADYVPFMADFRRLRSSGGSRRNPRSSWSRSWMEPAVSTPAGSKTGSQDTSRR